ncbi:STAS domain-containing protein [Sphingomonas sp. RS6]
MAHVIETSPSVTVRTAADFRQSLLDAFESDDQIEIDMAELAEVDLSFIQLLHAAREQARRAGKTLQLRQPAGEALTALLDRAGFLTEPDQTTLDFWFHGERPQ